MLFSGCSTVPLEPKVISDKAKSFTPLSEGNARIYVFRDSTFGGNLKKDIWIDDKCLGKTASNVFFYQDVKANEEYQISTESEFSPNSLSLKTENGKHYFIRQDIKMGVFVLRATLEIVKEKEARKAISTLDMAEKGTCQNNRRLLY